MNVSASVSFEIRPYNCGHKHLAKLIRAGKNIPMPDDVNWSHDIPFPFLLPGEEELFPGDILFEGQQNHRRKQRGGSYWVHGVDDCGNLWSRSEDWSAFKAELKAAAGTFVPELLKGSGELAACVRFAHVQRYGGLTALKALAQATEAKAVMARIAAMHMRN